MPLSLKALSSSTCVPHTLSITCSFFSTRASFRATSITVFTSATQSCSRSRSTSSNVVSGPFSKSWLA